MKRTTALIATLLALVVVALPSVASAASLNVRSAVLTMVSESGCDDAVEVRPRTGQGVLAQGTTTLFEARGVDKACAGRQLAVTIFRASGASLGTAVASIPQGFAGGTVNLTTGGAVFVPDVAGVAATLGTWGVAATWTLPGDVLPLVICRTESGASCAPSIGAVSVDRAGTTWSFTIRAEAFFRGDQLYINVARVGSGAGYLPFRARSVDVAGGGWWFGDPAEIEDWRCASSTLLVLTPGGYNLSPVVVSGYTGTGGEEQVPACA